MRDAHPEASPRADVFLSCAAITQLVLTPYLLLAGMVAAEMSAVLSVVLLTSGALTAVAAMFLLRRRRWAWRLSSALAAGAFLGGVALAFLQPAWVGGIHALGAAVVLGALWAGRSALPDATAPGAA